MEFIRWYCFKEVYEREQTSLLVLLSRHLACTGSGAKRSVPRKHPSGQGLPGYYSLTSEDKARVNEFFGWAKEVESELQSNSAFPEAYS